MKRGFLLTTRAASTDAMTKKPEGKVLLEEGTGKIANDKSEHKDFKVVTEDDDDDWKMTYVKVKDEFPGENGFWCVLRMARSPSPSNFSQWGTFETIRHPLAEGFLVKIELVCCPIMCVFKMMRLHGSHMDWICNQSQIARLNEPRRNLDLLYLYVVVIYQIM